MNEQTMHLQEDQILLSRIRKGEEAAFSEFYGQYRSLIYGFVLKYVKCAELSADVTQDIFVRFWENRSEIPEVQSLKSYLFIVARNAAFSFLKKVSVQDGLKEKIILSAVKSCNSTEDQLLSAEYLDHLKMLLNTLPTQTQRIFQLCREEEKSYQEVSAMLGISKDAVKKHMVRSMKLLRLTIQNGLHLFLSLSFALVCDSLNKF